MAIVFLTLQQQPNVVNLKCLGCGRVHQMGAHEFEEAKKQFSNPPLYGVPFNLACSPQCIHALSQVYQLAQRGWLLNEHWMLHRDARA